MALYLYFYRECIIITCEDKSSSVIPRTPMFVPHYGVLAERLREAIYYLDRTSLIRKL